MLTLYRSYTTFIRLLAEDKVPAEVLSDPNARFFFGCAKVLATNPVKAMADNFAHVTLPRELGRVERAVSLFANAYNANEEGLVERVLFAKTDEGKHLATDREKLEDLLGWERGTIVHVCDNCGQDEHDRYMTWDQAVYNYPCTDTLCRWAERAGIQPVVRVIWRSW